MLPFVFSALSMNAVGRAAMAMIEEVRRQFRDIPALKAALEVMRKYDSDMSKASTADKKIFEAANGVAEYDKCVDISTKASIKEMVTPGLLAILVPVLVGYIGGAEMLGGLLAGVTTCGVLMAIFQSNAGGAWDNAKKMIEEQGRKGSEAHKAAVVGDTVGDPFKDTSGPSLNILLKLMSVVALVIAPSLTNTVSEASQVNENIEINSQEANSIYETVESDKVVIYTTAINFSIDNSNDVTLLKKLILSNEMFCQSGGEKCDQFISAIQQSLEFREEVSSFAVSAIDAYSYQLEGILNVSEEPMEATAYYNASENMVTGQLAIGDMLIKFKGKK
jgi:hypothetical protein